MSSKFRNDDQAQGLRRLFARSRTRFIPVVSNPHVGSGGIMLERLCAGFAEHDVPTLVVDASERAGAPAEMALLDLAECIEPLSAHVSYIAARGLPLKFVDSNGSTQAFLQTVAEAAPASQFVLVHAPAADLCRMFGRHASNADANPVFPLLLADDSPASVTHAYGALKLLARRAGLLVHDLLLGAAAGSPRAERIAVQLGVCADDFLGAMVRDWIRIDPATDSGAVPTAALRRWVRGQLRHHDPDLALSTPFADASAPALYGATRFAASNWAFAPAQAMSRYAN